METKICSKCKRELPLSEQYSRGNGRLRSECKQCHKNQVKNIYRNKKDEINKIKAKTPCQKCGESRFYCLDFHHINPEEKVETIARLSSNKSNIKDTLKEIEKCIVLCANCHREFHQLEETEGITLEDYLKIIPTDLAKSKS